MLDEVRYERIGSAAVLTIDRQHRRNAVNGPTAERLNFHYKEFENDDGARVLIVTGAGGQAFAAGADLKEIDSLADRVFLPEGPEGFTRLTSSKPTIAAIEGWCVAGGLELALWCDLRIATTTSSFGFLERRFGVPLVDGGTQRLPQIVGLGRALELILTGRAIDADEARAIGLVNELVEPGQHLARAVEIAEALASFPQQTMLADRRAVLEGLDQDLQAGLWLEARLGAVTRDAAADGAARFATGAGRRGERA